MKLIQMNAWYWRLYWPMRRFLERERPDFMLVQESLDAERYQMADYYTARGIVAEGLARHYIQTPGKLFAVKKGMDITQGVAIFGQQPLSQVAVLTMDEDAERADPYFQLLHVTTEVAGQTLNLLTYHGRLGVDISKQGEAAYGVDTVPGQPRLGNAKSEADFAKISAYIETLSGPIIFTGDFNLWREARALEPLQRRLRNLVQPEHMANGRNELAWKTNEIVSQCFVSPEIKVNDFRVATDLVSDHQPLILDFDL